MSADVMGAIILLLLTVLAFLGGWWLCGKWVRGPDA